MVDVVDGEHELQVILGEADVGNDLDTSVQDESASWRKVASFKLGSELASGRMSGEVEREVGDVGWRIGCGRVDGVGDRPVGS